MNRHPLIDFHPDILPNRQPIRPRQLTLRAQRQGAGEFKREAEIEDKSEQADEATIGG